MTTKLKGDIKMKSERSCGSCGTTPKDERNGINEMCQTCGEYNNWKPLPPLKDEMVEVMGRCEAGGDGDFPCTTIGGGKCENLDVNTGCTSGFLRKVKVPLSHLHALGFYRLQDVGIDEARLKGIIYCHLPVCEISCGQDKLIREIVALNPIKPKQKGVGG